MKIKKWFHYAMYTYQVKEMAFVSTFRRSLLKLVLCILLTKILLVMIVLPYFLGYGNHSRLIVKRYPTDLKYILIWKPPNKEDKYRPVSEYEIGQKMFIKEKCEYINCYITYNRSLLRNSEDYDAVIFKGEDLLNVHRKYINLTRIPTQKYIFKTLESSGKAPICNDDFDKFFNLTWTYKLDSDIPNPFFNIKDENNTIVGPVKEMKWMKMMKHDNRFTKRVKAKDRAVAWIITNCKTKNKHQDFFKEFTNELKAYNYTLDIYGPCGKNKCPEGEMFKCYKMIEKRYFFLVVLEEVFEEDYVTDKVIKALNHFTIPIVLGGANYSRFLPPDSYINAVTHDIKKVGAIINYLIKNRRMYEYVFDWKNHYYYTHRSRNSVCDLCAKLNTDHRKTYPNFRKWWSPDYKDSCQRMRLLSLFEKYDKFPK